MWSLQEAKNRRDDNAGAQQEKRARFADMRTTPQSRRFWRALRRDAAQPAEPKRYCVGSYDFPCRERLKRRQLFGITALQLHELRLQNLQLLVICSSQTAAQNRN
jgi:hypothetical protein